jgi:hypothetical protein
VIGVAVLSTDDTILLSSSREDVILISGSYISLALSVDAMDRTHFGQAAISPRFFYLIKLNHLGNLSRIRRGDRTCVAEIIIRDRDRNL